MPELKSSVFSERGSTLVAVVTFAIIFAIAICGFLGVARTMANQEALGMNDDKALLAAESGLLIGTRWLRDSSNWSQYSACGYPGTVYEGIINNFHVAATITVQSDSNLLVASTASGPELPYTKILSWTVRVGGGTPAVFINDLSKAGGVGGGGLNNEWFDGPVRLNTPLYISSVSGGNVNVKFVNGSVKVHNKTERLSFADGGHWGNYGISPVSGNDYDFGISNHDAQAGQYSKCDPLFELNGVYESYQHSQDSLFMPKIANPTMVLPKNMSSVKPAIINFRVFNSSGVADYYYYDTAGKQQTVTFSTTNEIVRVPNSVSVLGTVKGRVTIATDTGSNIMPAGDLMYAGYMPDNVKMDAYDNTDNYGLSGSSSDVCGLVAGGDINFGVAKCTLSVNAGVASLSAISAKNNITPVMYVTAQLICTEPGHGIRWESKNANAYNYQLRALGTRAIDVYEESHNAQGTPGSEAFRFYYDIRFSSALRAPGVSPLRSKSQFDISTTAWKEENKLLDFYCIK